MFGFSGEHFLLLGIVLLIFGPRRLPELGNSLGKAMKNFKDAIGGVEEAKYRRLDETPATNSTPPHATGNPPVEAATPGEAAHTPPSDSMPPSSDKKS